MGNKFISFLKDNGIDIEDFEARIFRHGDKIYKEDPEFWIFDAFNWDEQPEGPDFWIELHEEWAEICKEGEEI